MTDYEWTTVGAGFIGLVLLCWRTITAHRQERRDSDRLLRERFYKGAELMGNLYMNVRWAGVVVMAELAMDEPDRYRKAVENFFLSYMAYPIKYPPSHPTKGGQLDYESRETVQVVRQLIQWRVMWVDDSLEGENVNRTIEANEDLCELHSKVY